MREGSKRLLFRARLKGGISKAAISQELGISRRMAAEGAGRGCEALSCGPRAAAPSILGPYKEIVAIRLSECPELSAVRLFRELRAAGYLVLGPASGPTSEEPATGLQP